MKSPSYQWYPKDIIGSERVSLLSLAEEGAYRRALDFCWLHGSLPADPKKIADLVGKKCTVKIASAFIHLFIKHPENSERLIHERLDAEREKQKIWKEKSSAAGKKSAEKRWQKDNQIVTNLTPLVTDVLQNGINQNVTLLSADCSLQFAKENTETFVVDPDPFFTMFRRAAGPHINNNELILELGKFKNKYPNLHPNACGALVNTWVANIGKKSKKEGGMVL